jgi:hypothetical protein
MKPNLHLNASLQLRLDQIDARLRAVERLRTKRGRAKHREAAAYLGKSDEWLRQQNLLGRGPPRNSDGTYNYDELDTYQSSD